jgi:dTDP-4-dehydrorhamnose 3,5-epimerase
MQVTKLEIPEVLLLEPKIFLDDRGFFFESFSNKTFKEATGVNLEFIQDNHSQSKKGVLRGLHYQLPPNPQGKLVRVVAGEIFDVAVDIRKNSPTFGKWVGEFLSADNKKQLWIPPGFAHGFLAMTDHTDVIYKVTGNYSKADERSILWNDPDLGIKWPEISELCISTKDERGDAFKNADLFV